MCGFLISKGLDYGPAIERQCAELLGHRGPDSISIHREAETLFKVFFARLVITGDRHNGHQPCLSNGKVKVFNGEVYNYRLLAQSLEFSVHEPLSDTEVLFRLIDEHGFSTALNLVDGMYAIVEVSANRDSCELAVDDFNQKPLYYYFSNTSYVISSSLRAIEVILDSATKDKNYNWDCYDSLGYNFGGSSPNSCVRRCFSRVTITINQGGPAYVDVGSKEIKFNQLPSVSTLIGDSGYPLKFAGREADLIDIFSELLKEVIDNTYPKTLGTAVAFSGGLDSTLLVAELASKGYKPRLYTVGFPSLSSYDETQSSKLSASLFPDLQHRVINWSKDDFFDNFDVYMRGMDAPIADMSFLATSFLFRKISEDKIRVTLGGDGLDELSCGYPSVVADSIAKCVPRSHLWRHLGRLVPQFESSSDFPFLRNLRAFLEGLSIRDHQVRHLLWAHYGTKINPCDIRTRLQELSADIKAAPTHLIDLWTYLPGMLMRKLDQASMNFGVEARLPFLQASIPSFLASLPKKYHFRGLNGKLFLKKYLRDKHNIDFTRVKKHGFGTPISEIVFDHRFTSIIEKINADIGDKDAKFRISIPSSNANVREIWHAFIKGYWMSGMAK